MRLNELSLMMTTMTLDKQVSVMPPLSVSPVGKSFLLLAVVR